MSRALTLEIVDQLELAIAGIHPLERDEVLRDARKAMCRARDYLKDLAITMTRERPSALARSTDPETSKAAAESDMTKMEREVHEVISGYGDTGCTQDQLLAHFPVSKSQSVMPRVRPLIEKGYVEETGETRTGKSGKQQRVVRATGKAMP